MLHSPPEALSQPYASLKVPCRGISRFAQYRATLEAARHATTLKAVQQGQDMSQGGSKVEDVAPELAAANEFPASARAIDLSYVSQIMYHFSCCLQ